MGFDEAFDAFVGTRRGPPFWIQLLNTPNCIPSLRLDDRETRLLPRSGFYNLTIDKDTRNSLTRSILGILTAKCGKIGCIRNNPWVALSDLELSLVHCPPPELPCGTLGWSGRYLCSARSKS
jgi:hypothetical protein